MKFKQSKNRKTKLHLKFDEDDRKNYLLGFRKRKLERKEKAKTQMKEVMKKEKKEFKKKRMELIKKMIDERTTKFESDSEDDAAEEDTAPPTHVEDYGHCTVEVSDLNLDTNKAFLGINKGLLKEECGATGSSEATQTEKKASFKLPSAKLTGKLLKTSIWKSASRRALKQISSEKRKRKKEKKKKKVMVTEL